MRWFVVVLLALAGTPFSRAISVSVLTKASEPITVPNDWPNNANGAGTTTTKNGAPVNTAGVLSPDSSAPQTKYVEMPAQAVAPPSVGVEIAPAKTVAQTVEPVGANDVAAPKEDKAPAASVSEPPAQNVVAAAIAPQTSAPSAPAVSNGAVGNLKLEIEPISEEAFNKGTTAIVPSGSSSSGPAPPADPPAPAATPAPNPAVQTPENKNPAPATPDPGNNFMEPSEDIPDLVIAIPSMRRWTKDGQPAPEHYLKPLVHGIVASMSPQHHKHVSFLLMNVDKEPEKHTELLELAASGIANITVITKTKNQHVNMAEFVPKNERGLYADPSGRQVTGETLNWRAGETMDAPRLLLRAHTIAPYVLFLEDDVTPTSNVVPKIMHRLRELRRQGKQNFLMMDLYTPNIPWGPESIRNPTDLGRYDFECCTQAMLFSSAQVPELATYEFDHPELPVDDNIRDFARADPANRMVIAAVPSLFEHVGAYSSNPEKSVGKVEHRSLFFEP